MDQVQKKFLWVCMGGAAQSVRSPEVVLAAPDGDTRECVHHPAVGVIAEADIDQQRPAVGGVRRVPPAFGKAQIIVAGLGKGSRRLVARQVVLWSEHGFSPLCHWQHPRSWR